jgi:gliding motility-associated-like protein
MSVITVAEPPILTAQVGSTPAQCNGAASGTLSATAAGGDTDYTYRWLNVADNTEVGTTAVLNDQPAGTYAFVLTDGNGCTYTEEVTIDEPPVLMLTNLQTVEPSCAGNTDGSASIEVEGGTEPYTITWDTGVSGENENSLTSGDHYVLVTDANMCTDSLAFTLDAPVAVTAGIVATATSCFGESDGTATVTPEGGQAPYTFLWSNGETAPTANDLPPGLASVEVRDANGCSAMVEITVDQPQELTVSLVGIDPSCFEAANGSIEATPAGGVGPYTFAWTDLQNSPIATNLDATSHSVVITDANGCTTSAELTLDQPLALELSTTSQEQACSGLPNGEAQVVAVGGTEPYTYQWEDGQQTATATGLTAGTYAVTVTDAQNCSLVTTEEVGEVETVEIIGFTTTDVACNGTGTGSIVVELQGGTAPFTWSGPLTSLTAGNYDLTVTDANNCTDILQASINEPAALLISDNITDVVCAGEITGAVDLSLSGGTGPYLYNWSTGANTEDIGTLGAGTYTVTVTDAQGCQEIFSSTVMQASELGVTAMVEDVLCNGVASGQVSPAITGGESPYSYAWSTGNTTGVLAGVVAGDYGLTITDAFGCTVAETFNVAQPAALSGSFIAEDVSCFGGQDGFLKGEMSGGRSPYRFRLNGGDWQPSSTFLAMSAGNYTLVGEDANGCQLSLGSPVVNQPAEISIAFAEDPVIIRYGETFTINPEVNGDFPFVSYLWEPNDTTWLSCLTSDCVAQTLVADFQRNIFLTVLDENGCTARAGIQIRVTKDFPVEVPTGFTPNGDTFNDRLLVHGLPGIEVTSYRIWDRWGELVYEEPNSFFVNDPDKGWNGSFRDQPVNGGVYLWQIEVRYEDDRTEILKGQTTLIR